MAIQSEAPCYRSRAIRRSEQRILQIIKPLIKLEASTRPSFGPKTAEGKTDRSLEALRLISQIVDMLAGWAIDHQIGLDDPMMPPRAPVRWSLTGRHDGWGTLGRPTAAQVYVMGVTHAEFGPRGLRREFTLLDETAVWKQILLATG